MAIHGLFIKANLRISVNPMVKIRVKAVKVGNSVRIAIPSEILREAEVEKGDVLLLDYDKRTKTITVEKAHSDSN